VDLLVNTTQTEEINRRFFESSTAVQKNGVFGYNLDDNMEICCAV
jgi:hypothetical protein